MSECARVQPAEESGPGGDVTAGPGSGVTIDGSDEVAAARGAIGQLKVGWKPIYSQPHQSKKQSELGLWVNNSHHRQRSSGGRGNNKQQQPQQQPQHPLRHYKQYDRCTRVRTVQGRKCNAKELLPMLNDFKTIYVTELTASIQVRCREAFIALSDGDACHEKNPCLHRGGSMSR